MALACAGCSSSSTTIGALRVTVAGLPSGSAANIAIDGPTGFHTVLNRTTTLSSLSAGTYSITVAPIVVGSNSYQAAQATQQATITPGATAAVAEQFAVVQATLQLGITGLPAGAAAQVSVTGPGGYSYGATASTTLTGLAPGDYAATAAAVSPGGVLYQPVPATQSARITPGAQLVAQVQYSHPESSLTITITAVYVTQGAQGMDGAVPLIPDRPGMVRIFLTGSEANSAAPDVRVRLYSSGVLSNTYTIHASRPGVPLAVNDRDSAASWNLLLGEHVIQPGLQLLVDVDPGGAVPLATRANLTYPASEVPLSLDVRAGPVYQLELVPVVNSNDGLLGEIGDTAALVAGIRLLHPMWHYTAGIHAPYTYTGGAFQPSDGNLAWQLMLQQLEMLRQAEGSSSYYFGVLHLAYNSGTVGLGYIGVPSVPAYRAALGWDSQGADPPIGSLAAETYAHELGHNLGLLHAPCGGAANPDPQYPYPTGETGHSGFNVVTGQVVPGISYDLMSYCAPTWISDYSYRRLFAFAPAGLVAPQSAAARRSVIVSGLIHQGGATLNPVMAVVAPPVLPSAPGPYRLEGRAPDGSTLFALSFAPPQVGDAPALGILPFVFTVPLPDSGVVARVTLTGPGIDTSVAASGRESLLADTVPVTATRIAADQVRLQWSAVRYPMLMVRDAASGAVLAFAKGGSVVVRGTTRTFLVTASDGVASTQLQLTP
jgi:hypothetical protein